MRSFLKYVENEKLNVVMPTIGTILQKHAIQYSLSFDQMFYKWGGV